MLKDIESGKFNGIIAWHPDRLARNILEAGMIVDMVDNDAIKGLQFPTHPFMDNASEKLNLNIQFALSKQQECSKKSRAVPIKIILEEIYKTLGELKFDERDYNRHLKDLKEYVDIKLDKLIVEKRSLLDTKRRKQAKINEYVLEQQMKARNPVVKTFWREKYY